MRLRKPDIGLFYCQHCGRTAQADSRWSGNRAPRCYGPDPWTIKPPEVPMHLIGFIEYTTMQERIDGKAS